MGRHRGITQVEIAKRLKIDTSSVNKILHGTAPRYAASTRRAVFRLARQLGYTPQFQHRPYLRTHPRQRVDWPVQIVLVEGVKPPQKGQAWLKDFSAGGAFLSRLGSTMAAVPLRPHTWQVTPTAGAHQGRTFVGTLVRHEPQGVAVKWS